MLRERQENDGYVAIIFGSERKKGTQALLRIGIFGICLFLSINVL